VQDKVTKAPRLNCRNWECGVIIPVAREAKANANANASDGKATMVNSDNNGGDKGSLAATFAKVVPVPMEYPSAGMNGKKPWSFTDEH
jgi:hypothetical protein